MGGWEKREGGRRGKLGEGNWERGEDKWDEWGGEGGGKCGREERVSGWIKYGVERISEVMIECKGN